MDKLKSCPYCGGKTVVRPFIYQITELPEPIKLFGKWSLIKMRYREIPCRYCVECVDLCDGFLESEVLVPAETRAKAIEEWNEATAEILKTEN